MKISRRVEMDTACHFAFAVEAIRRDLALLIKNQYPRFAGRRDIESAKHRTRGNCLRRKFEDLVLVLIR